MKNMRRLIGLCAAGCVAALFVFGCGGGGGSTTPIGPTYDIASYFPLHIGDVWVYDSGALQYNITGTETINGDTAYIRNEFLQGPNYNEYWAMTTAGLKFVGQEDNNGKYTFTPGLVIGSRSMSVGQIFAGSATEQEDGGNPLITRTVYMQSTFEGLEDVTETTPDYTNCLKMRIVFTTPLGAIQYPYYRWYLAQGIGMVKYERIPQTGAPDVYLLTTYTPAP